MKKYFDKNSIVIPNINITADNYYCKCNYKEYAKENYKIYRNHYISEQDLKARICGLGKKHKEVISAYIPDRNNIKSGEFGEITTTEIIISEVNNIQMCPYKLQYKNSCNEAMHFTDVIIITKDNDKYIIYSVEVKTKISNSEFNMMEEMLDGINNDITSRINRTIHYLQQKAIHSNDKVRMDFYDEIIIGIEQSEVEYVYGGAILLDEKEKDIQLNKPLPDKIKYTKPREKYKEILEQLGCSIEGEYIIFDKITEEDIDKAEIPSSKRKMLKNWLAESKKLKQNVDKIKVNIISFDGINSYCEQMYTNIKEKGE